MANLSVPLYGSTRPFACAWYIVVNEFWILCTGEMFWNNLAVRHFRSSEASSFEGPYLSNHPFISALATSSANVGLNGTEWFV